MVFMSLSCNEKWVQESQSWHKDLACLAIALFKTGWSLNWHSLHYLKFYICWRCGWLTAPEVLGLLLLICSSLCSPLRESNLLSFWVNQSCLMSLCLEPLQKLTDVYVCRTWKISWDKLERWHLQMHIAPRSTKGKIILSVCMNWKKLCWN